jgi:osmoprotectant transport system permease protein
MGLTGRQLLTSVEMPIGMPLIVTGLRIAALQIVATATLAAVIGGGGLGRPIVDGFAQHDQPMMIAGVYLVAALAMLVEAMFSLVVRRLDRVGAAAGSRRTVRTA